MAAMVVQVLRPISAQEISMVVLVAMHLALMNVIETIVLIVQLVIAAINALAVKLAIHNVIQIISDYFYALLYYFLQLVLTPINYLLIV